MDGSGRNAGCVMKTCMRCKGMFYYSGIGALICTNCRTLDEDEFKQVKEYIYANPGATAYEVSEATDIPISQIEGYLRAGRLEIPKNSPIFIKCEQCRRDIRYGRFCEECASTMSAELKKELRFDKTYVGEIAPTAKKKDKMHFLDRNLDSKAKKTDSGKAVTAEQRKSAGNMDENMLSNTDRVMRERLDQIVEQRKERDRRHKGW